MGYILCVHVLCYRCTWATHNVYMCYDIGVYGLHTMCIHMCYVIWATHYVYMCYVIGVYGLHTMCTCAML